jgi:survival-of-motor-neuron-related-splicing factor 30
MSPSENLDALHEELASHNELLSSYDELLTLAPDDAEILSERSNALTEIAAINKRIAAAKSSAQNDAPPQPKWDPTKHPKYNKPSDDAPPPPPPADEAPAVFNVKELVLAKWSGDKQFYEATIITKTGSSADPVYTVSFKIDNSTETKRKHEVRVMPGKKRKADGAPTASISTPPIASTPDHDFNSAVITAAPVVDKSAIQRKEPSMVSDGPTRMQPEKKKLKGGKVMESKKANWQSFQQSGPKKAAITASKHKESMFRTPDAPNAKVGVVGSGKPMQKDQSRSKWGNTAGKYSRDSREDEE